MGSDGMRAVVRRLVHVCLSALSAFFMFIIRLLRPRRGKQQESVDKETDTDPRSGDQAMQSPSPVPTLKIASCLAVRKTLVLDLDDTLVHSTEEWALNYDFTVSLHLRATDGSSSFYLHKRSAYSFFFFLNDYDVVVLTVALVIVLLLYRGSCRVLRSDKTLFNALLKESVKMVRCLRLHRKRSCIR